MKPWMGYYIVYRLIVVALIGYCFHYPILRLSIIWKSRNSFIPQKMYSNSILEVKLNLNIVTLLKVIYISIFFVVLIHGNLKAAANHLWPESNFPQFLIYSYSKTGSYRLQTHKILRKIFNDPLLFKNQILYKLN